MKRNVSHYIEEKRLTRLTRPMSAALCALALLAAAALYLPSCTNEPIFVTIENEIELRDPNLEGTVPSLVQYHDGSSYWLYACNGYVKRKEGGASPGSWQTVSIPTSRCGKLVAIENDGVYGLFQDSDWGKGVVYKYDDSGGWDYIDPPSGVSYIHEIGPSTYGFYAIVHTGSAAEENVSTEFAVYEYDGSDWTTISTGDDLLEAPIGMGGDYMVSKRRPYKVTRSGSSATISAMSATESTVTANASSAYLPGNEWDIMGMCVNPEDETQLYVLTDDYLWHYDGSSSNPQWTGRRSTGTSSYEGFGAPAYWNNPSSGGNDLVLMPLEEGYREVAIASGGTLSGNGTSPGNSSPSTVATSARSQYTSSIDDYAINFMYAVTDPDYLPDGCSYAVYASVGHYKYSGLWGYYQGVQQEWNRE